MVYILQCFLLDLGCVILISAMATEPGKAWRTDSRPDVAYKIGELTGGVTDRLKEFVDIMQAVGVSEYTEELINERWSKLMINCIAGHALPMLSLILITFLCLSLVISLFMNLLNKRVTRIGA